ncbi:hypothetical protein N658DRAFT_358000 [Parathielavia hyrcaniae]|uniref:Uncharacterized protein n=1 Tax=Parathielavia hyrcaniae TaxID=113614 RepID=A0AAN6T2W7_9PEZI|nr:hypothetical protein N658DRAFT_358000 [Parathielavia hyrcaniae]
MIRIGTASSSSTRITVMATERFLHRVAEGPRLPLPYLTGTNLPHPRPQWSLPRLLSFLGLAPESLAWPTLHAFLSATADWIREFLAGSSVLAIERNRCTSRETRRPRLEKRHGFPCVATSALVNRGPTLWHLSADQRPKLSVPGCRNIKSDQKPWDEVALCN